MQDNPQTSMLVSLGAGLGVGIIVGTMLGGSRSTTKDWFDRSSAERLGSQLMSQVSSMLPDAISDRLSG